MADLLRLQSIAATRQQAGRGGEVNRNEKAVIVIWLWGGPSHMEAFDLKPEAPAEFRGEFRQSRHERRGWKSANICLGWPGWRPAGNFAITWPRQSGARQRRAHGTDRLSRRGRRDAPLSTALSRVLVCCLQDARRTGIWRSRSRGTPLAAYNGSAYLPGGLDPFLVSGDPNAAHFGIPDLALERFSQMRFAIESICSSSSTVSGSRSTRGRAIRLTRSIKRPRRS